MNKYILEFVSSFVFQIVMLLIFALLYNSGLFLDFGGDKGEILGGIFFALPLGSLTGIVIVNKYYYKAKSWNLLGIGISMIMALVGGIIVVMLMDTLTGYVAFLSLLIIPIMTTIGYELTQSRITSANRLTP